MKKNILFIVMLAGLIAGCTKIDLDAISDQTINTSLAVPIGKMSISLSDIYKQFDTIITPQTDEDNTVFIYWEEPIKIDQFDIKDFTKGETYRGSVSPLDNTALNTLIGLLPQGTPVVLPAGNYLIADTLSYSFNFNETSDVNQYRIDSIIINQAMLKFGLDLTNITLDDGTYIETELSFPTLKSSKPIKFNIVASSSHIDLEQAINPFIANFGQTGTNAIDMYISFKLVSDGTKTISSNTSIDFSIGIENIDYDVVYGYIYSSNPICSNHTVIELPNTEQLDEFISSNSVGLYNPEFSINFTTNLGIDAKLEVNEIYAMAKKNKKNAIFNGKQSFTQFIGTPTTPHTSESTKVTLDRNFGGLNELFRDIPDSLVIDWDIFIGDAENKFNQDFITNPIQVDADFSVRIPIWFDKGTSVSCGDTIDADLTGINGEWANYIDFERFDIYLNFENTLPVHANAHLTFLDSLDNAIFTTDELDIPCPHVDELGRSTEASHKENVLQFSDEQIGYIMRTKKIIANFAVNGYDEESTMNFHASDGLSVKISAYATLKITATDNK